MTERFDIIIAGAGPAGSSAAIRLAQAGFKCLIIEKAEFPRHKLCGEFVSPECIPLLAELGVAVDAVLPAKINRTTFYAASGSSFTVPSGVFGTGGQAIGLSRKSLDSMLLNKAIEVGSAFLAGTVTGVLSKSSSGISGLRVKTADRDQVELTSDLYLDATGRTRSIARHLDADQSKHGVRAGSIALKAHVRHAEVPNDSCEIYAFRGGYGGCNAVEDGLHNVCFIVSAKTAKALKTDPEDIFRRVFLSNRRAAAVLASAKIESRWIAVPVDNYGLAEPAPAANVLAVGDSSAFIDPFTGSGILVALQTGRLAARMIAAFQNERSDRLVSEYSIEHRALLDRRMKLSAWLRLAAFSPMFGNAVAGALSISPRLASLLARSTRGPSG